MKGDLPPRTWVFKTADGWARRVLARRSVAASMILAEEIILNEGYAYRGDNEGRSLGEFKITDFISCEAENVET